MSGVCTEYLPTDRHTDIERVEKRKNKPNLPKRINEGD